MSRATSTAHWMVSRGPVLLIAFVSLLLLPAMLPASVPVRPKPMARAASERLPSLDLLVICNDIEAQVEMRALARLWRNAELQSSLRQMERYADQVQEAGENLDSFLEENEDSPGSAQEEASYLRHVYCGYVGEVNLCLNRIRALAEGRDPADKRERVSRGGMNPLLYEYLRFRARSQNSRHLTLKAVREVRNALGERGSRR